MLKRFLVAGTVVSVLGTTGAALARDCGTDCDNTGRAGRVYDANPSVVAAGSGSARTVRVWTPFLIDTGRMLLNPAVVQVVDGRALGAATMFVGGGDTPGVVAFGTADELDSVGTYTSNDLMIAEQDIGLSDTIGEMLDDGTVVFRANFRSSPPQNNLEWSQAVPSFQTPVPPPAAGTKILNPTAPGIDGTAGSVFLGTPAAIEGGSDFYVGDTNFDAGTGNVPSAVNIWDYDNTFQNPATPDFSYTQTAGFTFANGICGNCIDNVADVRQTQPVFAKVNNNYYVAFGINDTHNGGSARPALLVVDKFAPGAFDAYTGAIGILPPAGFVFVDHQATGGGSNVFESNHFEINSSGQIAALVESTASVPSHAVVLYEPILTAGVITGYAAPVVIADAGPIDTITDGLAGPIPIFDPNDPNGPPIEYINSISAVGINDRGNIAFSAIYDTGVPFDPNDPNSPTIWDSAAYLYTDNDSTLHQVLRENDLLDNGPNDLIVGLIAQEDSDSFYGRSLADKADVLAVNFRPSDDINLGGSRGTAMVIVGHVGDVNLDGAVNLTDLSLLLVAFGSSFGTPSYDPQADLNLDGTINLDDLSLLLVVFGQNV